MDNHFFYSGFGYPFSYGFWGFGAAFAFGACYYSPFFYYGLPYIYAPDVVVVTQPGYTYTPVPSSYYGDYYLNPGARSGLGAAADDIKNAWITGNPDTLTAHLDPGATIAISLNGKNSTPCRPRTIAR